jgi:hypothetical protein
MRITRRHVRHWGYVVAACTPLSGCFDPLIEDPGAQGGNVSPVIPGVAPGEPVSPGATAPAAEPPHGPGDTVNQPPVSPTATATSPATGPTGTDPLPSGGTGSTGGNTGSTGGATGNTGSTGGNTGSPGETSTGGDSSEPGPVGDGGVQDGGVGSFSILGTGATDTESTGELGTTSER